jgi:hypothetical protein
MRRLVLLVILAIVLIGAVGVLLLGVFPPHPTAQPIAHVLPNDRFGEH